MTSHGVASLDDPIAKDALASKYPPREREMPPTATKGQFVDTTKSLRDTFLALM